MVQVWAQVRAEEWVQECVRVPVTFCGPLVAEVAVPTVVPTVSVPF